MRFCIGGRLQSWGELYALPSAVCHSCDVYVLEISAQMLVIQLDEAGLFEVQCIEARTSRRSCVTGQNHYKTVSLSVVAAITLLSGRWTLYISLIS